MGLNSHRLDRLWMPTDQSGSHKACIAAGNIERNQINQL